MISAVVARCHLRQGRAYRCYSAAIRPDELLQLLEGETSDVGKLALRSPFKSGSSPACARASADFPFHSNRQTPNYHPRLTLAEAMQRFCVAKTKRALQNLQR